MSEDVSAVSAGRLYLDVVASTDGLAEDLKAKLEAVSRQVRAEIQVQVKLDAAQVKAQMDEVARDRVVKIKAAADTTAAKTDLDDATKDRTAKIRADADTTAARTDLDTAARDRTAKIKAKADTGTLQADIEKIGQKVTSIGQGGVLAAGLLDAVGAAGNLAGALVAVVGAASQAAGVIGAIPGLLSAAAQGGAAVVLGFSGVTGALKAMTAQQSTAKQSAYSMAQAQQGAADRVRASTQGLAAAQINAVQSVQSAQHNLQQSITGVADAQYNAAQTIQAAQHNVRQSITATADAQYNALQTVAGAEHALAEAEYGEQQAQIALNQARIDARQNLIQTSFALRGAVIGEAQATLNLQAAQIKLAQMMQSVAATPTQRAQAQLDVQQAQLAVEEAKNQAQVAAAAKAKADERGVEGSQAVIAARHAEGDASYQVGQSEQALARDRITTQRQITEAVYQQQQAVAALARDRITTARSVANAEYAEQQSQQALANTRREAVNQLLNAQITYKEALQAARNPTLGLTSQATTLQQAMAKLTPAGREFVTFIHNNVMPELKAMQRGVQEAFLPGVQRGVAAALPVIGTVQRGLTGTAGVLGSAATRFGQYIGSTGARADLASVMANNNQVLAIFADAGLHAADVMRQILVASEPLVRNIAGLADHLVRVVDAAAQSGRASGTLEAFFDRAYKSAVLLGRILDNVFHGIWHIFQAGAPAGTSLLGSLEEATKRFAEWSGSAAGQSRLRKFFADTIPVAKQVGDAIVHIAKVLGTFLAGMGGGQYNVLFSALNTLLSLLNGIAKVPGLGPVLNWVLALSAAGIGLGRVASNIGGIVGGLTKLTKLTGLSKVLDVLGVGDALKNTGAALKQKGSVADLLKSGWSKILGSPAQTVERAGADRVFVAGGETAVTDLSAAGAGVIPATGLRKVMAGVGDAAKAASGAVSRAMSTAVTAVTGFVSSISLATIKTALFAAGSKIAAAATRVWAAIQAAFNIVMDANPIILVGVAIAALVAGVIYAYTHFKWFRDAVQDALHVVGAAALWLWHNVFDPVWDGIRAGAVWLYKNGIKPYFDLWVAEIRFVQGAALWLWHNVLDPMVQGIAKGAQWLYKNGIKPYFDLWVAQIRFVQAAALWLWHNVFDPAWHGIQAGAQKLSDWFHQVFGTDLANFFTKTIPHAFDVGVQGIKAFWSKLGDVIKAPINFIIGTVYDDGIRKMWNFVVDHIGLKSIELPKIPKLAAGGRITQGTHSKADDVLARVSKDETVVSAEHSTLLAPLFALLGVPGYERTRPVASRGRAISPLFAAMGIPAYQTGGVPNPSGLPASVTGRFGPVPGVGGVVSSIGSGIKDIAGKALDTARILAALASGNSAALANAFYDLTGHGAGGAAGDLAKIVTGIPKTLITDAVKWLIGRAAGSGSTVLDYAMQFAGKVPYIWGGADPSGWDCSGMISWLYEHFHLLNQRMTAAGLQTWGKASNPTPGGMVFFGRPAYHVGMVKDATTMLSALGSRWGTIVSSLAGNSGFAVPPQGFGTSGAVAGGATSSGYWVNLGREMAASGYGWVGQQFDALNKLWTKESGWDADAVNPGSGAYGIPQALGKGHPFNLGDGIAQIAWGLSYILQRWGSPVAAWANEVAHSWYDRGGRLKPGLTQILNATGRDEWVLNPHAVDALGGPDAVNQLNMTAHINRGGGRGPLIPAAARGGGAGSASVNVYPQPYQSEEEIGAVAARKLGMLLAG